MQKPMSEFIPLDCTTVCKKFAPRAYASYSSNVSICLSETRLVERITSSQVGLTMNLMAAV